MLATTRAISRRSLQTVMAFALDSRARAAFVGWRSLLIPVAAIVPIVPVAYWLATVDRNLVFVVHDVLIRTPAPYLDRVGEAVWKYVTSIFLYILPWPIFIGLISCATRRPATQRGSMHSNGRLVASMTLWRSSPPATVYRSPRPWK